MHSRYCIRDEEGPTPGEKALAPAESAVRRPSATELGQPLATELRARALKPAPAPPRRPDAPRGAAHLRALLAQHLDPVLAALAAVVEPGSSRVAYEAFRDVFASVVQHRATRSQVRGNSVVGGS